MKKNSKTTILAITIAIMAVAWIIAIIAFNLTFDLPWMCWGSVFFTILATLVAEAYLLVFRKDGGLSGTEVGAMGIIVTVGYLLITALLNTVFVLLRFGDFNALIVVLNILAIAAYVVILLWVEKQTARLTAQLARVEQKTAPSTDVSRKLGELLAITSDAEIRGKLLKLKESVDYSTNISTDVTAASEKRMSAQLDELVQLTIGDTDRMILLNKIDAAEKTWKMRSSIASSTR